jgi:hypothetical protein
LENETAAVKREPQNAHGWYKLAAVESCLGRSEAALDHLATAINAGWTDFRSPGLDPRFDGIASETRFRKLIQALTAKVVEQKRQTGQPIKMASNGETNSP